jgi:hypothetical protein
MWRESFALPSRRLREHDRPIQQPSNRLLFRQRLVFVLAFD